MGVVTVVLGGALLVVAGRVVWLDVRVRRAGRWVPRVAAECVDAVVSAALQVEALSGVSPGPCSWETVCELTEADRALRKRLMELTRVWVAGGGG